MRGQVTEQNELFSYIPLEARVPKQHPLRRIKDLVDPILEQLSPRFDAIYSTTGRPSIPPEMLLKALLLQVLYGIRSEFLLLEQIDFNLLYRWFVGLSPDDAVWDESVFTKNRNRLLRGQIADLFFHEVVRVADKKKLVSKEHFTVDGTLIEAWASLKSLIPKEDSEADSGRNDDGDPGNPNVDFRGEKRSNQTHESSTDPEAKIYTKASGSAAKLNYMGHVLMENRSGLAVEATLTEAGFHAERDAAIDMIDDLGTSYGKTLGADKAYDEEEFCEALRDRRVTPHVAQNIHKNRQFSAIDGRTTRHPGYEVSCRKRKRVEEIYGWLKGTILRRVHFRGLKRVGFVFKFAIAVYNLLRISNLAEQAAA
jgi:transposase